MKKILLALALTLLTSPALAVPGDVNNDCEVTAADALATLQYAVGLDVDLVSCEFPTSTTTTTMPGGVVSEMRFRHLLTCGGSNFSATLTAHSPGGGFSRSALTGAYSEYQRLYSDDTPLTQFRMTTPTCGGVTWSGSFKPPAGIKLRAQVTVAAAGIKLHFYSEGPRGKRNLHHGGLIAPLLEGLN
jgi:hypothetical protein